jgi:hypothetical protein
MLQKYSNSPAELNVLCNDPELRSLFQIPFGLPGVPEVVV